MSSIFLGQIYFSESLGCKLTENYDGFENSSLFFQRIVRQSKKVRHSTCLETKSILILNFPQISTKYPPKNQKRIIFHKLKQFWWIWSFMPMSTTNQNFRNLITFPKLAHLLRYSNGNTKNFAWSRKKTWKFAIFDHFLN
jgi:hypothetical protein